MFQSFTFVQTNLPEQAEQLRGEVRAFLKRTLPTHYKPNADFGAGGDVEFSKALGACGWIGMTWPKQYGGGERSFLERYIVTEELLAAGAPVGHHWIADRQTGPLLLKFGSEQQRQDYLPAVTKGELFFSIGMSEPNSGSDLASVRCSATPVASGYRLNGSKLWTSGAHHNHYMITLVRTLAGSERRHGLSQLIVDLKSPDVEVRPIKAMTGEVQFNEVVFNDLFVPESQLVGKLGNGWEQVTSELGYERSGPERFLSTFRVLLELVRSFGPAPDDRAAIVIGRLVSHLMTLRKMSISVAGMLQASANPILEAALVKELGNNFEKLIPELARLALGSKASPLMWSTLYDAVLHMPSFTLRGGTREILRGIIARGLGLR